MREDPASMREHPAPGREHPASMREHPGREEPAPVREESAPAVTGEHRSDLGHWERAWRRPAPPLRGLVGGYHGYRQRLATPAVHRGVPGAVVPLVLSFGPPQSIASHRSSGPVVTVDSFLAGVYDHHVLIDAPSFHGIQVDLTPIGAHQLLGRPLRELTGRTVPLPALLGPDADRLVDDLASAPDWPSRFHRLDRELSARLAAGALPDREVIRAWHRLVATGGTGRVAELAEEVGWSQRHLTARFGEQLGLTPKRMGRLLRFERAAAHLARPDPPRLAELAVALGYTDQAHLSNEVRSFSGLSPSALVASHLPDAGGVFDTANG
jgi:AraC-like DNA-binding protein